MAAQELVISKFSSVCIIVRKHQGALTVQFVNFLALILLRTIRAFTVGANHLASIPHLWVYFEVFYGENFVWDFVPSEPRHRFVGAHATLQFASEREVLTLMLTFLSHLKLIVVLLDVGFVGLFDSSLRTRSYLKKRFVPEKQFFCRYYYFLFSISIVNIVKRFSVRVVVSHSTEYFASKTPPCLQDCRKRQHA